MLSTLLQYLWFGFVVLLMFNLTIFIHELGHYLAGRWRGAKIERFAVWFGPALWSKTIDGVEFRLGCIPLGGYVAFPQLAMEAIEGKSETPEKEIPPLRPSDKIPILVAGSIFNIFLGFAVATIIWFVGIPRGASEFDMRVGHVSKNSPESTAGILAGDKVVSINGKPVSDWEEVTQKVALSLSREVQVGVERDGKVITASVLPEKDNLFKIRRLGLSPPSTPVAGKIHPNTPADKGGLKSGDMILEIDGIKVLSISHMLELVESRGDQTTRITVKRKDAPLDLTVIPKTDQISKKAKIGMGFAPGPDEERVIKYPDPLSQVTHSLLMMADTLNALLHHKTTGVGIDDLSGPVGITEVLFIRIMLDIRLALAFMVMLNINLAVVNLLPIPVLDGGHVVFTIIEAIRKKPIRPKIMEYIQTVFVIILLGFMLYVTFNDVIRSSRFGLLSNLKKEQPQTAPKFEAPKTDPAPATPTAPSK